MSKDLRPPFGWAAVQSCFDEPIYDAKAVKELFLSLGAPAEESAAVAAAEFALRELTAGLGFDFTVSHCRPT